MRILVAGDAMLDRYWFGEVSRISPEAPVPCVSVQGIEERQGGAANVARNIEAMGVSVSECFSPSWTSDPVIKLRVIARNQQVARVDFDHPQKPIDPAQVRERIAECDCVVLSDYAKGSLARVAQIIEVCKTEGKRVLVDPKGHRYERYRNADLVKPNQFEIRELVGGWDSEAELREKIEEMRDRVNIGAVLVTFGSGGMTLYNGVTAHFDAEAREVYDVSGAGDTAIAAFAAATVKGFDQVEATRLANKAAGVAVGRFGTAVVKKEEVFV